MPNCMSPSIYPPTIFLLHPLTLLSISMARFDLSVLTMCAHSYKLQEFKGAAEHQLHLAGVDHCGTIGLENFFCKKKPSLTSIYNLSVMTDPNGSALRIVSNRANSLCLLSRIIQGNLFLSFSMSSDN